MKKAHFIGICGVGMGATALLLKEQGWDVSGSDEGFYPPMSTFLEEKGVFYTSAYNPENIKDDIDLIVIGKHAKLIPEENTEVKRALESDIPVKSFPEVLGEITKERHQILIAGSYGKSTCTALMAWCLKSTGRDIGYMIGAIPIGFDSPAHLGKDPLFIIEGDEYPASNWDSRSKFLFYKPHDLLITSLEHDHMNVFKTLKEYIAPFLELKKLMHKDGLMVIARDAPNTEQIKDEGQKTITYSLKNTSLWGARDIHYDKETIFTLTYNEKPVVTLRTKLLGKHSIENIVGVSAFLLSKKLIELKELQNGIATFEGLKRRLDQKKSNSSVLVYEGFGSSFAKARSAIEAINIHFPRKKLFVVFEPHTFSWRNRETLHWYDTVFNGAQRVIIYNPPTHGATSHDQVTLKDITDRVVENGFNATGVENPEEALEILRHELKEDDIILLLTSGDLGGLITSIPQLAEQTFPKKP